MELPDCLKNAVESLSKIPGIGGKTALRHVLTLCQWGDDDLRDFSDNIFKLAAIKKCQTCFTYTDNEICSICANEGRRSERVLCVVESITDYLAIERSGHFSGTYHVLGGVLNPLMGIGPDDLKIEMLLKRIMNEDIKEVILAVNPSIEGDATCSYIRSKISKDTVVDRIGFGIPIGGSLEYLDPQTISKGLENRRQF